MDFRHSSIAFCKILFLGDFFSCWVRSSRNLTISSYCACTDLPLSSCSSSSQFSSFDDPFFLLRVCWSSPFFFLPFFDFPPFFALLELLLSLFLLFFSFIFFFAFSPLLLPVGEEAGLLSSTVVLGLYVSFINICSSSLLHFSFLSSFTIAR